MNFCTLHFFLAFFLVCCFSLYLYVCMNCIATTSWWIKIYILRKKQQRHTIAHVVCFSVAEDRGSISMESASTGDAKYRCGRLESAISDQYLAISQKMCKIQTVTVDANRNLYVAYRMVHFQWPSVTLTALNNPIFYILRRLLYLRNGGGRDFKFGRDVAHSKFHLRMTSHPRKGCGRSHVTNCKFWGLQ